MKKRTAETFPGREEDTGPIGGLEGPMAEGTGRPSAELTSTVLRVVPPVVEVDLRRAGDHQLQLSGVEHRHQPRVHHLEGIK